MPKNGPPDDPLESRPPVVRRSIVAPHRRVQGRVHTLILDAFLLEIAVQP